MIDDDEIEDKEEASSPKSPKIQKKQTVTHYNITYTIAYST